MPHPGSCLPFAPMCDSVQKNPVTLLSPCRPASDGEHLAMFIAVQVQREASSTIEKGKLAAAPLCGKHHHTPRNQNKDTEKEKTLQGLRKLQFFPILFCHDGFYRKHFLNTTVTLAKSSCGIIMDLSAN